MIFERKKVKVDYAKYDIEYTYFNYLDNGSRIDEERKIIRFDVVMSFDVSHSEGIRTICEEVKEIYPEYDLVIVPDIDITD